MTTLVYLGGLIQLIGIIWLVITAIQVGKTTGDKVLWAILNLICQPITGIIFYFVKRAGLVPLILVIVGAILVGIGYPSLFAEMQRNMR